MVISTDVIKKDYATAERDPESGHQRSLLYGMSRITTDRGSLLFDDKIDALSLGIKFFTEAAAQDQVRQKRERQEELDDLIREAWFDETGASLDDLACGFKPQQRSGAYGGVRR